jgi:hypothetical protein
VIQGSFPISHPILKTPWKNYNITGGSSFNTQVGGVRLEKDTA